LAPPIFDSRHVEHLFAQWANELKSSGALEKVVAIDGKTARSSKDTFHSKLPIHLVHPWSVENNLCQYKTESKSNEITTIPELLDMLDIKGSSVTIDAMGTQTAIAQRIIEKEANYIFALNRRSAEPKAIKRASVMKWRQSAVCTILLDTTDTEKGHGRIETRRCQVFEKGLVVDSEGCWAGLQSVIKITSMREIGEKITTEEHYF
jgi:predicted transposase YbfD/YdcC